VARQLDIFGNEPKTKAKQQVVNVASVPQRSPFRYPGGKTWLIPTVRKWLKQYHTEDIILVEPFAGGGIVSLTAGFENLANHVIMVEMDEEVAAVWKTILSKDNEWLANRIFDFELTRENAKKELEKPNKSTRDLAFSTILKNRIFHGGIITKGAGFIKKGENGKGITSRWYPKTLRDRILTINHVQDKIDFIEGDAFKVIEKYKDLAPFCFFIDPPYYRASKRLYTYFDIDHEKLFQLASQIKGHFLMTYDDTEEIRELAHAYHLAYTRIPMKTTHHLKKYELLISDRLDD